MRRPQAARRGRHGQSAFSLLELLVVVVIVGILAAMLTLSVGISGGDRDVEREADRMAALIGLALEDAVLQGRELGLRFFPNGFEFISVDPDTGLWGPLPFDEALRPRELGNGIRLSLEIEGREILLEARVEDSAAPDRDIDEDSDDDPEDADTLKPQVYIFSSGDVNPPFLLRLRREFDNRGVTLDVQTDGAVEISRDPN